MRVDCLSCQLFEQKRFMIHSRDTFCLSFGNHNNGAVSLGVALDCHSLLFPSHYILWPFFSLSLSMRFFGDMISF